MPCLPSNHRVPRLQVHHHESRLENKTQVLRQLLPQASAGKNGVLRATLPKFPLTRAILGTSPCINISPWLRGPDNPRIQVSSLLVALSALPLPSPFGNPPTYILLPPFPQKPGIWGGGIDLDLLAQGSSRAQSRDLLRGRMCG